MSHASYPIRAPKQNRLKAPKPLQGLDGIATPKIPRGPLPPAVRERADSILRQLVHKAAGQVRRTLGMKPAHVAPYEGYASPSHQQWGLPEPSRFPPMPPVKPPKEEGRFVHPSLIEAAAELRALREDLTSEDWRDKIRDRAAKLDQSRTTTVHKTTSLGPTGWAPTQPDIDLHDITTGFHDSVPAMFGLDSLSHLPERKMESGTIHAEPPPPRNAFGLPTRIYEGDYVRQAQGNGQYAYAQVTHCHPNGALDVETLPNRRAMGWSVQTCELVPDHTLIPMPKGGIEPDQPWPRKRDTNFVVGDWVMLVVGPEKGTVAQIKRIHPHIGYTTMLEVMLAEGPRYWIADTVCHWNSAPPAKATSVPSAKQIEQAARWLDKNNKPAPRPRFLQRTQREPFDFESFFGPLCIAAFMVGLIGAIIANKLVMGVGLIATVVFGVLGLRK